MSTTEVAYLVFGIVIAVALLLDLGLLSKRHTVISIKKALYQTLFWVSLSALFFIFLWFEESGKVAIKYFTAYLMEWSLSIDNIFVFILIFSFFKVSEEDSGRALLIGIMLAIVFRIAFIAVGIGLINKFHWLLYLFGAFLVYTGIKLFSKKEEEEYNPGETRIYKWFTSMFRISNTEPRGRYVIRLHGKIFLTNLFLVVVMLAATDVVFAVDSIPTVVSIVRDNPSIPFTSAEVLVIYSSNIFAVLGLRSLYFLLRGAVSKFDFLQQGIAIVLVFIGLKMLAELIDVKIPIEISLIVIVVCLGGSVLYSIRHTRAGVPADEKDDANNRN